ncbi:MAG: (deoxy)nucleoside triphosphate pyrophosphohydrolase [Desulfotomaculum sp.]|nr:(deoxy)nucleoside triphosphate pyrophosphohydrolase [Desulfotomaculum sp.]
MIKVAAAIIIKDGLVLIAKRKEGEKLAGKWEFPGGKIEDGESPEECLQREIMEELQINISIGEYFGDSVYHYQHGTIHLLAYLAYWNGGKLMPTVHQEVRWVTPGEMLKYEFSPADIPLVKKLAESCVFNC